MNTQTHSTPRIWLVIGDKLGDNAQAKMIADRLGLPYETRRLLPREKYVLGSRAFASAWSTSTCSAPTRCRRPGRTW